MPNETAPQDAQALYVAKDSWTDKVAGAIAQRVREEDKAPPWICG